jgi:2-C-methyl-D-erythritol 4-phosphate cytidylyltransferase/2-C-methyl-D-erythritol 2,4-cyclodiphosphate synthase
MGQEKAAKAFVIMVAAGRGQRAGGAVPKQYRPLHGEAVLTLSLRAFLACERIDQIQCVIHPDDQPHYFTAVRALSASKQRRIRPPVFGGETRQQSVFAGLNALASDAGPTDLVLIHDAARPFVSHDLITRAITEGQQKGAAIPALPVTDTLKQVNKAGEVVATPDRATLMAVQTPQVFNYALITKAHHAARQIDGLTDDAMVVEHSGYGVHVFAGESGNFKLTTDDDFIRAEQIMRPSMLTLTGFGYDVHAFAQGDHVTLAGIQIPHDKGVRAHSDGDVILHALCDAIFGVLGDGDIGQHFPPSDPQWKGVSSDHFVRFALKRLHQRKGRLLHADITLVAEAPRIGPHRPKMIENLATLLDLPHSRIGLKATTSESMGFTGRKEGLAASVVVSITLPEQEPF